MNENFIHGRRTAGLLVMMAAILLAACGGGGGGGGGTPDETPTPTAGGQPSVVTNTATIPPGDTCPNGGISVESGIDENGNGVLDPGEVDTTQYVCNGLDATNFLVITSVEPAGQNCAYGGWKIQAGIDDDADGVLDPEEIDATQYVCDGAPGTPGGDGSDGADSLIKTTAEPPGDNCAYGGWKIETGIDDNGNGVLDVPGEVDATQYICNGSMDGLLLAADNWNGTLYAIDPVSGDLTALGPYAWWSSCGECQDPLPVGGMAYLPSTGTLYLGSPNSYPNANIFALSYDTAEGRWLADNFSVDEQRHAVSDMTVRNNGTIFAFFTSSSQGQLTTIDPRSGEATEIGDGSVDQQNRGGNALTFDPAGTTLYLADKGGLHVLNQTTGEISSSKAFIFTNFPPLSDPRFNSLTVGPAGRVYGILNDSSESPPRYLASIDLDTAEVTNLGRLTESVDGGSGFWEQGDRLLEGLVYLPCSRLSACNAAPVADAGTDQTAAGMSVTLAGSAFDPDNDPFGYQWTLVSKPAGSAVTTASLSDPNGAETSFVPDKAGDYVWQLFASDGLRDSLPDTVTVTVLPPFATFDDGTLQGWSATGLWHVSTKRALSGAYSVWYGNPATNTYETFDGQGNPTPNSGTLTSPPFVVGALQWLRFSYFRSTECEIWESTCLDDPLVWQISSDGGATWSGGGYLQESDVTWTTSGVLYLGGYVAQSIQVRFFFDTVNALNNNFEGAYIDNIYLDLN